MKTAELIVRALDLASGGVSQEGDINSEQLHASDAIRVRYGEYKRRPGYDFARASFEARVEVIELILRSRGLYEPEEPRGA
jgi:hypothetical protein